MVQLSHLVLYASRSELNFLQVTDGSAGEDVGRDGWGRQVRENQRLDVVKLDSPDCME